MIQCYLLLILRKWSAVQALLYAQRCSSRCCLLWRKIGNDLQAHQWENDDTKRPVPVWYIMVCSLKNDVLQKFSTAVKLFVTYSPLNLIPENQILFFSMQVNSLTWQFILFSPQLFLVPIFNKTAEIWAASRSIRRSVTLQNVPFIIRKWHKCYWKTLLKLPL